jgi:hypothetical protein
MAIIIILLMVAIGALIAMQLYLGFTSPDAAIKRIDDDGTIWITVKNIKVDDNTTIWIYYDDDTQNPIIRRAQ